LLLVLLLGFGFWLTLGCVVGAAVVLSHGWCWLRVWVLVGIWDLVVVLAMGFRIGGFVSVLLRR
jgi:hypothetical protein